MLDDKSVMAVIRAARPTFRNRHDKVAFAVHAAFLASGCVLTAIGPAASSSDALSSSNSEEVGFENWNEAEDKYAFVYANLNKGGEKVLLKCLAMEDRLTINALACGDFEPLNCEINVQECVEEEGRCVNYASMYKNMDEVVKVLNGCILQKLVGSSNLNQLPVFELVQPLQNIDYQKGASDVKLCLKEDVALMSSWCLASKYSGNIQKGASLWQRVHNLFNEARAENLKGLCERNVQSLKGRWERLNENAKKWIAANKEAYGRKKSGMSFRDVEKEAHAIYEVGGNKFNDLFVFNEVMRKHPKWELKLDHVSTRFRPENEDGNEENGGSSKRPRISKDGGEYSIPFHPESPISRSSSIPLPTSIDATKKEEGKGATSQSTSTNEVAAEIRALRLLRENEVEIMSKLGKDRIELELKKEQRKAMKMNHVTLNTLLAKNHLSSEDEDLKRYLISLVLGKR